ncbi:angiopoietin-1 receptor-like isoform X2 [Apostichopus japonicus]|uniref:angiopoietin-1 receptor-like isoform X2 n=1 Tax=Stichopus japonicus TaxID=307972 RepID=UPI003AB1DE31
MTYKVQVIAVTTLLLWQTLLSYGQNEPVKMTFLGVKPFQSQHSNTQYQFHLIETNTIAANADVGSFRTIWTRNNATENVHPPAPVWNAGSAFKHWRVKLNNNGKNDAFGVFGCEAEIDGKISTSISGIFMRSDADIVPSDELVSLTVDAGDTGVSIGMKNTGSKNVADFRWLKDNVNNDAFNGDGTWVISGPVEVDDAGVYECHINGERSDAKQGLKLLIVRACPAQRWGPDTCDGICDNCYNGGICDENSGKCICAPGFKGANCEEGCGGNKYGDTCEKQCSTTGEPERCSKYLFCLAHPYGCSCNTGWKGLDCLTGTYGASCLQTCGNCQSDECDIYTGSCTGSSTSCEVGWTWNSCQECEGARFGEKCAEDCHCSKEYCNQVTGECSGHCNAEWVELYPPNLCQIGLIDATYTRKNPGVTVPVTCTAAKGPSPSDISNLNFVLSRHHENLDNNGISPEEVFGNATTRTAPFMVDNVTDGETLYCQLRKDGKKYAVYDITIDVFDLPVLQSAPKKGSITNSSVTISWSAWDEETEDGDPPVIGYTPYYKLASEQDWSIQDTSTSIKALNFTFTALTPEERYSFSVAAVREGEMGEGPRSPMLNATTICTVLLSGPGEVQANVAGERRENVEITWQLPSDMQVNCGSGVSKFTIYYSSYKVEPYDEGTKDILDPDATSYIFDNLMVGKTYKFQMTLTTAGGESPFSDEVTHLLPNPEYDQMNIIAEVAGEDQENVKISWKLPADGSSCSSGVTLLKIYYASINLEPTHSGAYEVTDPSSTSFILTGLKVEGNYSIDMTLETAAEERCRSEIIYYFVPKLPEYQAAPAVSYVSSDSLTITWPVWDGVIGTPPVVEYRLFTKESEAEDWPSTFIRVNASNDQDKYAEIKTPLEPDTEYDFMVVAVREGPNGDGPPGPILERAKTNTLEYGNIRDLQPNLKT